MISKTRVKAIMREWVKNHPDVFTKNYTMMDGDTYTQPFWWVQNCVGDLIGWPKWYADFINELWEEDAN